MKGVNAFGSWTVLILAGVAGIVALGLTKVYLDQKEAELREQYTSGESEKRYMVVVATDSIDPGDVASPRNLRGQAVPGKHLPATAVTVEQFKQGDVEGRVINQPMRPGEPLLSSFLAGGAIDRFSDLLKPGERAVTLEVDQIASNAGMLEMGDYVDLYVRTEGSEVQPATTGAQSGGDDGEKLVPLRDRVRVLSVGRQPLRTRDQDFVSRSRGGRNGQRSGVLGGDSSASSRRDRYATVTVALKEEEAARVALAREAGDLVFMLRNTNDEGKGIQQMVDEQSIWEAVSGRQEAGSRVTFYAPSQAEGFMIRPGHLRKRRSRSGTDRRFIKSEPVNGNRKRVASSAKEGEK
ncbi:Flp pilus assembly protein CpaB [Vreelandella utahensis]|uniref:Flp pilus assembly protein CpaB n=1 Tax=Vreelandella halophila TaxID=86177 RepID=UPI0015C335D4|nr:Flp pilus assembly protein CpaB [Halomonas utahensis]